MNQNDEKQSDRRKRNAIWSNVAGCECSSKTPRGSRCTMLVVRCNARLRRIHRDLAAAGLAPTGAG